MVSCPCDYQNRWVRKALDSDGDGHLDGRRIFIYDVGSPLPAVGEGSGVRATGSIVMDFQRANSEDMQIGHLRQRYLWGPAVDQILAEEAVDGGTADLVQWTLADHLNTVRDIAQYDPQTGATTVVNHLVYDAFGRVTSETGPAVDSLFLFTARPFDADTGLQNNLNRWYDPSVGRWLSEDPIGFAAGDGNLYRYCANTPVLYADPSGSDWLDCMTACVQDNDPINLALEAAVAQFTVGLWPKRIFAAMADAMGDHRLANAIRFSAHYGETTTMPKALLTLMRAKPHKAFDVLLRYGGKTVGRANIAYGLALAAIEVHCCGYCTTAALYGVPYNPRDANIYDTIRTTYFSWL